MKVLEVGGRRGGMSLYLALKGCKDILCTDYCDNTEIAKINHKKFGINYINYGKLDVTNEIEDEKYDLIVFKSVLGGVGYNNNKEKQQKAIDNIYKALKPGGKLIFAENLVASSVHKFCREKFVPHGKEWRYLTIEEIKEMTKKFKKMKFRTYGFFGTFGRREYQRKILGKIDCILDKVIPNNKKYIIFAILEK